MMNMPKEVKLLPVERQRQGQGQGVWRRLWRKQGQWQMFWILLASKGQGKGGLGGGGKALGKGFSGKCYNCGEVGRRSFECPKTTASVDQEAEENVEMQCFESVWRGTIEKTSHAVIESALSSSSSVGIAATETACGVTQNKKKPEKGEKESTSKAIP